MEGHARISPEVLASYAADAAQEVKGVRGVADSHVPGRRGVRIALDDGKVSVELHLSVDWGASIPDVGRAVQEQVADYLERMADVRPETVDVVVDGIAG